MVVCCKCNRSGHCRNCACVKAGKTCQGCLPSRLNQCTNINPPSTKATQKDAHQDAAPTNPTITDIHQNDVHQDVPTNSMSNRDVIPPDIPDTSPSLPTFIPLADSNFVWGETDSIHFKETLKKVYEEVVHWRKNCFKLPSGNVGKSFVAELARLYNAFAAGYALESVALMATTVLPILALQKPHQKSKVKEHMPALNEE